MSFKKGIGLFSVLYICNTVSHVNLEERHWVFHFQFWMIPANAENYAAQWEFLQISLIISSVLFILNDETILMLKFLVCSSQQLLGYSKNLRKDSVALLPDLCDRQCYEDNWPKIT